MDVCRLIRCFLRHQLMSLSLHHFFSGHSVRAAADRGASNLSFQLLPVGWQHHIHHWIYYKHRPSQRLLSACLHSILCSNLIAVARQRFSEVAVERHGVRIRLTGSANEQVSVTARDPGGHINEYSCSVAADGTAMLLLPSGHCE